MLEPPNKSEAGISVGQGSFWIPGRQFRNGLRFGLKVLITELLYLKVWPSQPLPRVFHDALLARRFCWRSKSPEKVERVPWSEDLNIVCEYFSDRDWVYMK